MLALDFSATRSIEMNHKHGRLWYLRQAAAWPGARRHLECDGGGQKGPQPCEISWRDFAWEEMCRHSLELTHAQA